jgi:hypothetical protein
MVAHGRGRTRIRRQLVAQEEGPIDRHWRGVFLDTLAETSNVTRAAREAGVSPGRAYAVRRKEPQFAHLWHEALLEGYQHLEMETLNRLRDGTASDGPKFDIANALRLLALHRETAERAQAERRNVSAAEVRASIDRKVEEIRLQVQAEHRRDGTGT